MTILVIITHQNPHDMKINLRQAAVTNVTPAAMMKKSGWRATWCLTIITMTMIIIKMVMMIIMVMMDDHGDKDDREDGVDDDTISYNCTRAGQLRLPAISSQPVNGDDDDDHDHDHDYDEDDATDDA